MRLASELCQSTVSLSFVNKKNNNILKNLANEILVQNNIMLIHGQLQYNLTPHWQGGHYRSLSVGYLSGRKCLMTRVNTTLTWLRSSLFRSGVVYATNGNFPDLVTHAWISISVSGIRNSGLGSMSWWIRQRQSIIITTTIRTVIFDAKRYAGQDWARQGKAE